MLIHMLQLLILYKVGQVLGLITLVGVDRVANSLQYQIYIGKVDK